MANLYLHEVQKLVDDLIEQEAYLLAFQVSGHYMDYFNDGYLRFKHLYLPVLLDCPEQSLALIEQSLVTDQWFSSWFLTRSSEFDKIKDLPRFQELLVKLDSKEAEYWQREMMKPITCVPEAGTEPYPWLVALHGNGFNTLQAAEEWSCAARQGWLSTFPLSNHLVGNRLHWWDSHAEAIETVETQVVKVLKDCRIDQSRVLLGGFSKGGEVATVMALKGQLGAKGFITVGAGGYLHAQPEKWQPLIAGAPSGLRGVMMYSPYDLDRVGSYLEQILPLYQQYGVQVQVVKYDAAGHVFPKDFDQKFNAAVDFIFDSRPSTQPAL
jgi:predicted esterase